VGAVAVGRLDDERRTVHFNYRRRSRIRSGHRGRVDDVPLHRQHGAPRVSEPEHADLDASLGASLRHRFSRRWMRHHSIRVGITNAWQ
jgi:hypothetical protein